MTFTLDTIDLEGEGYDRVRLMCRASADVINNKIVEGSYRTNNNGRISRTFTITGVARTGGGTTTLQKMEELYDLIDASAKFYLTNTNYIFDTDNKVYVRMTDIEFDISEIRAATISAPFTISLIEAIE